ncbi:uncharacterized protein LOC110034463 [Phalaenopsis equestris]|uniref:uncharacterized protein LOC110034463 n=1 Tax=Phalaenopsis equestris TaxID=78828 RepID=UPI0009E6112A|nr:uncharacterized protein LOC110034463 [Phalaenopsis equestris]
MEAARMKVMGFLGNKDNIMNLLLAGAFAALSWRSYQQQREIDELEAEKLVLRSGNTAMSSTMWAWREHLFHLAEADPSSAPIPLARLRAIYGEEEKIPDVTNSKLDGDIRIDQGEDGPVNEPIIA